MPKYRSSRKWYQQKRWLVGSAFLGLLSMAQLTEGSDEQTVIEETAPARVEEPIAIEPEALTLPATSAYRDAVSSAEQADALSLSADSATDWVQVAEQWELALSHLYDIPTNSRDYSQAQQRIAEYERGYENAIAQENAANQAAAERIQEQAQEPEQPQEEWPQPFLEETEGSYVSGTCRELRDSGVGSNFRPGDANYTAARDRDNDGIACES